MNQSYGLTAIILSVFLSLTGCASVGDKFIPTNDEVLVYELPYDLTYLRTIEALEHVDGWFLELTEKRKGLITVRNVEYGEPGDKDTWIATFTVKRLDRNLTSVQLVPESIHVREGDLLLAKVAEYLELEL